MYKKKWYPSQTDRRVHQSRCQRPRSGDVTHSVMWPANASTARWLVSGQEVWVGWGWWGRGWFQASRCGVKPRSLLAGWKIFLLRNEAQVVWSVKIPKLKHCGGRSTEGWGFFWFFFESDWFCRETRRVENWISEMAERVSVRQGL